jgi:hypothetical protein
MVILWIDLLSIYLIYVAFCDLISICIVLVLFMLTASRSLFLYILTWMIKLILDLVNFLTILGQHYSARSIESRSYLWLPMHLMLKHCSHRYGLPLLAQVDACDKIILITSLDSFILKKTDRSSITCLWHRICREPGRNFTNFTVMFVRRERK